MRTPTEASLPQLPHKEKYFVSKQDLDEAFLRSLLEGDEVEMSVFFSDPSLPDNPMIFVSNEF